MTLYVILALITFTGSRKREAQRVLGDIIVRENEYKEILSALLGLLNEGVHIVAGQGTSIFYNSVMARMEQMEPADVVGRRFEDAFSHMDLESSTIYRALQAGASTVNQPQRYINASGKYIHTINTTIPVKDADGKLLAVIEVANDVTQLSELCDRLAHLQSQVGTQETSKKQKLKRYHFSDLIGRDPKFQKSMERAKRAAQNDMPVLIYGETGTGKELFAQSLHTCSHRAKKPFISQNCAAIPESLLEGIFFGVEKGSFTGAENRKGLFELADGGTLFLDEINSMDISMQAKLLKAIEEQQVRRIGSAKSTHFHTRIICAMNKSPAEVLRAGLMRTDLFYRICVVRIDIPPLRDRKPDVMILTDYFINHFNRTMGKSIRGVSALVKMTFQNYNWKGNVRELNNVLEHAMNICQGDTLKLEHFDSFVSRVLEKRVPVDFSAESPLERVRANAEAAAIRRALELTQNNRSMAARLLKISRTALYDKMQKYNISSK